MAICRQSEDAWKWEIEVNLVYIDPKWETCWKEQCVRLVKPMPNASFLLATAERVIRYAQELKFPDTPSKIEVDYLREVFETNMIENANNMIEKYLTVSKDEKAKFKVWEWFDLNRFKALKP